MTASSEDAGRLVMKRALWKIVFYGESAADRKVAADALREADAAFRRMVLAGL